MPLLSKLSVEEKDRIAALLVEVSFADGAVVFEQGSVPNGFYIIKEGTAAVTQQQDTTTREVARLGRGDYFGEAALINSAPRGATVTAVGPLICMFADSEKFKGLQLLNIQFASRRMAISAADVPAGEVAPRAHADEMDSLTRRTIMRAMDGNVLFVGLSRQHKELIVSEMYPLKIKRV